MIRGVTIIHSFREEELARALARMLRRGFDSLEVCQACAAGSNTSFELERAELVIYVLSRHFTATVTGVLPEYGSSSLATTAFHLALPGARFDGPCHSLTQVGVVEHLRTRLRTSGIEPNERWTTCAREFEEWLETWLRRPRTPHRRRGRILAFPGRQPAPHRSSGGEG